MFKKSASIIAASSLLALTGTVFTASAAVAAEAVDTCSVWHQDEVYNVAVQKTAERTYSVTITDFKNLAFPSSNSDSFVALPTAPVDLRFSQNVVKLNPALAVSDITISQSVLTANEDGNSPQIQVYNRLGAAPLESATLNGSEIIWIQDMDARTDENNVMVRPSDYPAPWLVMDDSAGVLEFVVTVPDDISGEVTLFDGMSVNFTSSKISANAEVWAPDLPHSSEFPGCTVTVDAGLETKPEPKPEPQPEPGVTRPTGKEPIANTGASDASLLLGLASAAAVAGGTIALAGRRQKKSV